MELENDIDLNLIYHLSTDELRQLMNDDDRLTGMVTDLPQVTRLRQEQEMLLVSNKSLAEHNFSMEPKLTEGKQLLISSYEEASKLADSLTELKSASDSSSGQYKPDTVQALLQTGAHEMEEQTEKIVAGFLENGTSIEDFISEFISQRTIAHTRRIKAEKVAEMIRNKRFNSGSTTSINSPVNSGGGGGSGPLPYPMSYNMPMPGF